jgi:hypothetical protein
MCHNVKWLSAKCHSAKCHSAECRGTLRIAFLQLCKSENNEALTDGVQVIFCCFNFLFSMSFVKREPTKENWIRVGIVEKT